MLDVLTGMDPVLQLVDCLTGVALAYQSPHVVPSFSCVS